jgi:hypothetical protein
VPELEQTTGNQPQQSEQNNNAAEARQPFWEETEQQEAEQNPEPAAEADSGEAQAEGAEAEQAGAEETESDWLPDEQQKVFPDEVLAKYAARYGRTLEQLQADPQLKQLIQDKINSDIFIQQQKQQQEVEELVGKPTPGEQEAEQAAATAATTPEQRAQWLENLVTQSVDPKAVEQFGYNFLVAAGIDPKDPASKEVLAGAGKIGKALTLGAADLLTTLLPNVLPQFLPNVIEQQYPKFGEMHGRTLYQLAWENVRASKPEFANLPEYGKGLGPLLEKAQTSIPNFDQIASRITGTPYERAVTLYTLLAGHAAGEKVTPAAVKQALDAGKKQARDAERSRAAGKMLGAGQSTKQFAGQSPGEEFKSMIEEYNASQLSTPIKG